MALTDTQRRTLQRKAADNSLEVEHLVKVASIGDAKDASFLRTLKTEHKWSDTGREGRARVVPFGRWTEAVCRFLEEGYAGVVRMAGEGPGAVDFCVAILVEMKTPESVAALLTIGGPVIGKPGLDVQLATLLASSFNRLLCFKDRATVNEEVERRVRQFLHQLLVVNLTEAQRAAAVCALRGVGDAESIALIERLPPFRGPWAGVEQQTIRQIKQRLRRQSGCV